MYHNQKYETFYSRDTLSQWFPQILFRMVCSIRFIRRPRLDGRVDHKMTLNNCSSLDSEAHLKGRTK